MSPSVLIDTGPLVALLSRKEKHHDWVKQQFARIRPPLYTCEAVVTEACYLLGPQSGGAQTVLGLLQRGVIQVSWSLEDEAEVVAKLLMRYANVPIDLADACLVRMAELDEKSVVLTLDSDFNVYRIRGRAAIPVLMPEDL